MLVALIYLVLFYFKEKSSKWVLNGYYRSLRLLDYGVTMEIEYVSQSISFHFRAFSLTIPSPLNKEIFCLFQDVMGRLFSLNLLRLNMQFRIIVN